MKQERALRRCREDNASFVAQNIESSFEAELEALKYPTNDIQFSLSNCQGDGMAFYGTITDETIEELTKRMGDNKFANQLRRRVGILLKRHTITNDLVSLGIERNSFGHHYAHYNTMVISQVWYFDNEKYPRIAKTIEKLIDCFADDVKDTSRALEKQGYDIIDDMDSEEMVTEDCDANDIYFDKYGDYAPPEADDEH